jgi:hypothetical protein
LNKLYEEILAGAVEVRHESKCVWEPFGSNGAGGTEVYVSSATDGRHVHAIN